MTMTSSPVEMAETLAALVDTLIPGDDLFPSASTVGTQALLADRLRWAYGRDGGQRVVDALASGGRPFVELTPAQRVEAVSRMETEQNDLFAFVRMAAYLAYYAAPPVVEAIRRLGHDYNDSPLPQGYELPKFDFAPGVNVPMKPKGWYKPTDLIKRIDVSGLEDLGLPVQESQR